MAMDLNRLADRQTYRVASVTLWLAAAGPALIADGLHFPYWSVVLAVIWGSGLWIILTIITYKRLKDAGLWGGLVILMIMNINFGPVFYQSAHDGVSTKFTLGGLIGLVPIVIGWFWHRRDEINEPQPGPNPLTR